MRPADHESAKKIAEEIGIPFLDQTKDQIENLAIAYLEMDALVNNPQTADFLKAVDAEAAHQVARWGAAHDRSKSAENWFWLVGYLAGKALRAAIQGDREKALHHTISSAAALRNWHAAIAADGGGFGVGQDVDLKPADMPRSGREPEATRQQLVNHIERIKQASEGGDALTVLDEIRKAAEAAGL